MTDELLPCAFSIHRDTQVWVDTVSGWFAIDAASQATADDVRGLPVKSIDQLPLTSVHVKHPPVAAITGWLLSDEAPSDFTADQNAELRSTGEGGATVRYAGRALEAEDMRRRTEADKQCMRLAMTQDDRVSFVLTPSFLIKCVIPLDVIKGAEDPTAQNDDERFSFGAALMTDRLARVLSDLVDSLGGDQLDAV